MVREKETVDDRPIEWRKEGERETPVSCVCMISPLFFLFFFFLFTVPSVVECSVRVSLPIPAVRRRR